MILLKSYLFLKWCFKTWFNSTFKPAHPVGMVLPNVKVIRVTTLLLKEPMLENYTGLEDIHCHRWLVINKKINWMNFLLWKKLNPLQYVNHLSPTSPQSIRWCFSSISYTWVCVGWINRCIGIPILTSLFEELWIIVLTVFLYEHW